ncbi:hypothetical protein O4J55_00190 [Paracoccus sp. PXZ]
MIDILLLAGVALCVLSVLLAIVSVARTQAPRGAAILLVLGIVLLLVGGWRDQRPFGLQSLEESWQRLVNGEVTMGTDPVTAPAPEAPVETPAAQAPAETPATETPAAEPAPEAGADEAEALATEAPAVEAPAADAPAADTAEDGAEAPAQGQ